MKELSGVEKKTYARRSPDAIPAISTKDEINQTMARINGSLTIISKGDDDRDEFDRMVFSASSRTEHIDPTLEKEFKQEFAEDLDDFRLRVQRLKVRAASSYMAGSWRLPDEKEKSYSETQKTPEGELSTLLFKHHYGDKTEEFTDKERARVTALVNPRLPERLRIESRGLSRFDAEQLYDAVMNFKYSKSPTEERKKILEYIIDDIHMLEEKIDAITGQRELFDTKEETDLNERRYKELWTVYRLLLKQIANCEELDSWFSPTYGMSGKGQKGDSQSAEPFWTDYQRFKMPELETLEKKLGSHYFRSTDYYERVHHFVFNGGLNALQAVYAYLDADMIHDKKYKQTLPAKGVFVQKDMYFEVDYSLEDYCEQRGIKPDLFKADDARTLARRIKKDRPKAVFLTPLSNSFTMDVCNVTKILEELSEDDAWGQHRSEISSHTYLIIDDSTVGRLAKWHDFDFSRLPKSIRIISFESLVKYAQDGQDLVPAGLVTTIGEYADSEMQDIRSRKGFTPPENTVRKLSAFIPEDFTDKKMARHSRNAHILVNRIRDASTAEGSFIRGAIYPGTDTFPQKKIAEQELISGGGLLSIDLNFSFLENYQDSEAWGQTVDKYSFTKTARVIGRAFDRLVVELAKTAKIDVNVGTSFGFHTTRLAAYDRPQQSSDDLTADYRTIPYIRIAVGTENIKDAELLGAIIARANEIFTEAIRRRKIIAFAEKLNAREGEYEFKITAATSAGSER